MSLLLPASKNWKSFADKLLVTASIVGVMAGMGLPAFAQDNADNSLDLAKKWNPNAQNFCLPPKGEPEDTPQTQRLKKITDTLGKSKIGAALLKDAQDNGTWLCFDKKLEDAYGQQIPEYNLIALASDKDDDMVVATLAHELRHANQVRRGLGFNITMTPTGFILNGWSMEADAKAVEHYVVCKELPDAGEKGACLAELQKDGYRDITTEFVKTLMENPDNPHLALRTAFDQWFSENEGIWRRDQYASDYFIYYAQFLAHETLPLTPDIASRSFSQKDILTFGQLPDGSNYMEETADQKLALENKKNRSLSKPALILALKGLEGLIENMRKVPAKAANNNLPAVQKIKPGATGTGGPSPAP